MVHDGAGVCKWLEALRRLLGRLEVDLPIVSQEEEVAVAHDVGNGLEQISGSGLPGVQHVCIVRPCGRVGAHQRHQLAQAEAVRLVELAGNMPRYQVRAKLLVAHHHVQHHRAVQKIRGEQQPQPAIEELGLVCAGARIHVQRELPNERQWDNSAAASVTSRIVLLTGRRLHTACHRPARLISAVAFVRGAYVTGNAGRHRVERVLGILEVPLRVHLIPVRPQAAVQMAGTRPSGARC